MSHEITDTDSMISRHVTPWHGLGDVFEDEITSAADMMAKYPNLDYQVGLHSLHAGDAEGTILKHRCSYRMDTGEVFAPVGPSWTPLQNRDAVSWFDAWVANGAALFETAGSLKGGRIFWCLAKWLGNGGTTYDIGDGDEIVPYVVIMHAHDGSLAIYAGVTTVRVVCFNTLSMALEKDAKGRPKARGLARITHVKGAQTSLEKLQLAIENTNASIENTVGVFRSMASRKVGGESWIRAYVDAVFGRPDTAKSGEWANPKVAAKVTELFESGTGQDLSSAHGTTWGLYNALTEFVTHHQGKLENRAFNLLPGQDKDRLLQRALSVATVMGQGIPLDAVLTPDQLDAVTLSKIAADGAAIPAAMIA